MGKSGGLVGSFRGKFEYSVDNKGRINIPSKFRSALNPAANETFVIIQGPDKCLQIYPVDEWEVYESKLMSSEDTKENIMLRRATFNMMTDSTLDAQGRITLSAPQMAVAGITKSVTLVGQARFIEVWDTNTYENVQKNFDDFDSLYYKK